MKYHVKTTYFYWSLALSIFLHSLILIPAFHTFHVTAQPAKITISLRSYEWLPRVETPSEKTHVKNNPHKHTQTGNGIIAASQYAISDENSEKTMLRYTDMIRQKIRDVMIYPHHARIQGIEGRSFVRFSIHSDGTLISVQLVRSSGYAILDEEAISAIRRAAPFPKLPNSIQKDHITFIQGLNFELK